MKHDVKKDEKNHKRLKIFGIIIVILMIIICIFFFLAMNYLDIKLGKIKIEAITNDYNELGISQENTISDISKYRNIAILGLDSRYDTYDSDYRTDCIMIVSINTENNDVQLYSIYRDTYLEVEEDGIKKMDKINHAYYNGVENTLKAINTNLDLNITEYIMADFNAVADLVESVGGIEIDIDSSELKYINSYIKDVANVTGNDLKTIINTGTQKLNGVQAVAYCRIRYTDGGDYKRTERMREVLGKVISKIKNLNLIETNNLLDRIIPEIRTNITVNQMKEIIPKALSFNFEETFGWPYTTVGVWMRGDFFGPAATLESNVRRLHQEVYGQTDYVVPDKIKEISDKIVEETKVTEK